MIPDAVECTLIKAVEKGQYVNAKVFLIDGTNGFYRQVGRDGRTGLTTADGATLAQFGERFVELMRWDAMEQYVSAKSKSSVPCRGGLPCSDKAPAPAPPVESSIKVNEPDVTVTKTNDPVTMPWHITKMPTEPQL